MGHWASAARSWWRQGNGVDESQAGASVVGSGRRDGRRGWVVGGRRVGIGFEGRCLMAAWIGPVHGVADCTDHRVRG